MKDPIHYNDELSFGRVGLQKSKDNFPEKRQIIKINNMIQYMSWDFNPPDTLSGESREPLRGQLFTIPPEEAQQRMGTIAGGLHINVFD